MAKSHSVACKMVLVVAIAIVANLLCFPADAGRGVSPSLPLVQYDDCNSMAAPTFPECDACCRNAGHPGGYIKGDQCLCNPG